MLEQEEVSRYARSMSAGHDRLRAWKSRRGLSTAQLARALGCARPTLSLILNGHQRPGLVLAAKLEHLTRGTVRAIDWVDPSELTHADEAA